MSGSKCNPNYKDAVFAFYRYEPSVAANVVFVILFAISTILHIAQVLKLRTWYMLALVAGGCAELIGYVGRVMNANEEPGCWSLGTYVMQNVLILVAPALMAASIYMILGRIILLTEGERHSIIRKRWLTKIFVSGDVVSLLMQASGGGLMAIDESTYKTGQNIIIGGLFVQILFFGCFLAVSSVFHWRMTRDPTTAVANDPRIRWKHYLTILYVTGSLIWVRSLFRAIEFIDGNEGPLMRSETYVFVFDGMLMVIAVFWMNWFHPGEIGLLLRGDEATTNGLQHLISRRGHKSSGSIMSLASSARGPAEA